MAMRVLVIEDEQKMADLIKRGLEEEGMKIEIAGDGEAGLAAVRSGGFEIVVLDLGLPGRNGMEIARELRAEGNRIPILILTAQDSTEMKVKGLNIGADDYLTKPFAFAELLARLRALQRRTSSEDGNVIQIGDLMLNLLNRRATRAGVEVQLTGKEFELLKCLMSHPDETMTRDILSEKVWDGNFDQLTNVIDVYINYLRNKIDRNFEPKLIETVRGRRGDGEANRLRGYKFVTPQSESRLVVESKAS
ncbi:MAG: response regulator transcription factor [Blastocatellia bacterium]|jgi:DNA-binding response OmpR family regulator